MISNIDHRGSDKAYGWTKQEDGTVWYWNWNGSRVAFTDRGTPTNHPIRSGPVPEHIQEHAEACVESKIRRGKLASY